MFLVKCFTAVALVVLFAASLVAGTLPAPEGPKAVELPEGVVATVNGEEISEKEWLDTLKRVAGSRVLDVIISHRVIEQAAAKEGIVLEEAQLTAELDKQIVAAGSLANLEAGLKQRGETIEGFKALLKTNTLLRRLAEKSVTVADEDVAKFFKEKYGPRADLQLIVVASKEKAELIVAQAKAGTDFGQLALDHSTEPNTARTHGHLPAPLSDGFFPKIVGKFSITAEIAARIFKMKAGEISEPIAGAQGEFCIFRLGKLTPAKDKSLEAEKEQLTKEYRAFRVQDRARAILGELMKSAVVAKGI